MWPTDWHEYELGELLSLSNGINADRTAYGRGTPFINVLEVITNESLTVSDIPGRVTVPTQVLARYRVNRADVLFNRTSETQEEVGLAAVYLDEEPVVFGGFVFRGRPTTTHIEIAYSKYALRATNVRNQITARGQGGIRANIGQRDLKSVVIRLPGKPEQRAIGRALDDAEQLIATLERLITKKQAIKQGMMQQLLTGRTRLPGFTAEWRSTTIGSVADQHRRTIDPRKERDRRFQHFSLPAFDDGEVPVNESGAAIDSVKFLVPSKSVLVSKLNPRIPRIWAPKEVGAHAIASTEFVVMTPTDGIDRSFLKWLMKSDAVTSRMKLLATGTTGSHARIHPRQIAVLEVEIPSEAEQIAIATALDDVDREIGLIGDRLVKARSIKTGMMQQLLTGRTRLPVEVAS
ncbi:MAG: restriction endonuclease subunit S [Leucobacter sp.]